MFKVETGTTTEFGDGFEAGFGFEAPPFLEWSHDGRSLFVAQLRPGG